VYRAKQGDIIWLNFNPQAGNEQSGRRPALIISNDETNEFLRVGAMVCPITNNDKGIPIQVPLDSRTKTQGVIMCDQTKILNIKARNAEFIETAPEDIIWEVADIIKGFL